MLEIREARPEEFAAAGGVAVAGYAGFYGADLGYYEDHLRDVGARTAGALVLVALEASEVVGTVTYVSDEASPFASHQREGEGSIRMLAVAPAYKRRGIGRALSLACLERGRAEGKQAVILHADEVMRAARTLYEGLGFRRDPARDYRPDDVTFLLCYVRDLSGAV